MNLPFTNRLATATVFGSACLFAAAFWLLDAGSLLWRSDTGFLAAVVPERSEFLVRLLYATIFAVAGSIAGAAVQRGRDIEEFAIDQLTESERKYRALLASSFDCVLILNSDARVVELSDSAAALFGTTARAMIGTAIDDLVEFEAGMNPHMGSSLSELLREATDIPGQGIAVRAHGWQGRQFPAEIRVTGMPNAAASAFLISVRETTATVVAQKALRHSERRYQALFDNIPDGVYRSQPDGRLLAANPALCRMLGYSSVDELLARGNAREIFCDQLQRETLLAKLEQAGEARNLEMHLLRRDGSKVLALANIRAVVNDKNEDILYEGTLTDITDLCEARKALQDSEEHFRALCEHTRDVINVINSDGDIVYSNPSSTSFSRRTREKQRGLKFFSSMHPDDLPTVRKMIAEGFARPGTSKRFYCRIASDDGSMHRFESIGTAFLTRNDELRAVIHSRDVTENMANEVRSVASNV